MMYFDDIWTPQPDSDGDRAVPATYRKMAPWESAFARNGHRHDAGEDRSDTGGQQSKDWILGSLMGVYND